jgi:hypothetical protein
MDIDPEGMRTHAQQMLDRVFEEDGLENNLVFRFMIRPDYKDDGQSLVFKTHLAIVSQEPKLVIGVVDRMVLKDMVLTVYFTDLLGDDCALNGVSFRTYGTEGPTIDTKVGWI